MSRIARRPLILATTLGLVLALAACGGGGSAGGETAGPPTILRFEAVGDVHVGDMARLRAEFSGGVGRIAPDGLEVASGTDVLVGPLDRTRPLRLVVSRPGAPDAVRDLTLTAKFRDRYVGAGVRLAISHHGAVATADGGVLLVGGSRGQGALAHQIDRYDPRSDTITPLGSLRHGRAHATCTRLPGGQVLVAGGESGSTEGRMAELIDERSGAVSEAGRMSVTRVAHAALALADGRVLVTGGISSGEGAPLGLSRSAELWDPATRSFRRLAANMLEARANHSMSLLADGRVLIVGGYSNGPQSLFAEIFDPRSERFTAVAGQQMPRAEHAAYTQADGRVLIVGGEQPRAGQEDWEPTATVLRFDPATQAFDELPPLTAPRTMVQGALLPDGDVLLFGGRHTQSHNSSSAERYNPARGGVAIARMDGERAHHTVTRLSSGRIVLIGGENREGEFATGLRIYE
jgi:hypothetical protein